MRAKDTQRRPQGRPRKDLQHEQADKPSRPGWAFTTAAAFARRSGATGVPGFKEEPVKFYPIFVVSEGRPCAVYGGGHEASLKVQGLLTAGARRHREEPTDHLGGEFPALLDVAGEVRTRVRAANRMPDQETWQTATSPELRALCVKGRLTDAKRLTLTNLGLADLWQEETVING